jgi:5-methyltetrahydrofolate corrinoid/iron sulfur protein methyltransferase
LAQGTTEKCLISGVFLAMAASHGMDAAIVDVLDEEFMDVVATTDMLLNKQLYSDSYLKAYRNA